MENANKMPQGKGGVKGKKSLAGFMNDDRDDIFAARRKVADEEEAKNPKPKTVKNAYGISVEVKTDEQPQSRHKAPMGIVKKQPGDPQDVEEIKPKKNKKKPQSAAVKPQPIT